MIQNKRILSLSPFIVKPFIHGSITRIYYLNKYLALDNEMFFLHRMGEHKEGLDFPATSIQTTRSRIGQLFSPSLIWQGLNLIKTKSIDYILANHIWSGLHGVVLSAWKKIPLIFDNHNVEHIRFKRVGSPIWPAIWLLEKFICTQADRILCVSEVDKTMLIDKIGLNPIKLQIIDHGVEVERLKRYPIDREAWRMKLGVEAGDLLFFFFGSFTYPPNIEAADLIVREIVPRLIKRGVRGKILLAGNGANPISVFTKPKDLSVEFLGFVNDLISHIKSADVLIVPLKAGSGTRFKILETLACGIPVVTTTIGAEGLDLAACGPNLHLCDEWDQFADIALQVAQKPPHPISRSFVEKYDWQTIVK